MDRKIVTFLSVALIAAVGFAVYVNSLKGEFVFDDHILVRDNSYIKDWSNFGKVLVSSVGSGSMRHYGSYRPLQMITYMVNYSLGGLKVEGYHLGNILLHILAALSLFWFINVIFGDTLLSLFTSLLFVSHPIHTEAVTYISGRADSLSALFMLLCFIFYLKNLQKKNIILAVLMVLSYILALFSRENSLMLPVLLLVYHYSFGQKIKKSLFITILAPVFAYILLRLTLLKAALTAATLNTTLLQRIPGFFTAITDYFRLLIAPLGLHMEYGDKLFSFAEPKAVLGVVILLFLLVYAFIKRKSLKLVTFSILWFFTALLPSSNLYPLNAYMAEHWLYIPSIGFFLALSAGIAYILRKEKFKTSAIIIFVSLLAVYSYLTVKQNSTWVEPEFFYKRTLRYAPDSSKSYNNLALIYAAKGQRKELLPLLEKAIEIRPHFAEAYNNLAIIYRETGEKEKAVALYKKALKYNPNYASVIYYNMALVYGDMGQSQEQIDSYKKAIEINPRFAAAYYNLAEAYYDVEEYDLAVSYCDKAVALGHRPSLEFLKLIHPYRK